VEERKKCRDRAASHEGGAAKTAQKQLERHYYGDRSAEPHAAELVDRVDLERRKASMHHALLVFVQEQIECIEHRRLGGRV